MHTLRELLERAGGWCKDHTVVLVETGLLVGCLAYLWIGERGADFDGQGAPALLLEADCNYAAVVHVDWARDAQPLFGEALPFNLAVTHNRADAATVEQLPAALREHFASLENNPPACTQMVLRSTHRLEALQVVSASEQTGNEQLVRSPTAGPGAWRYTYSLPTASGVQHTVMLGYDVLVHRGVSADIAYVQFHTVGPMRLTAQLHTPIDVAVRRTIPDHDRVALANDTVTYTFASNHSGPYLRDTLTLRMLAELSPGPRRTIAELLRNLLWIAVGGLLASLIERRARARAAASRG